MAEASKLTRKILCIDRDPEQIRDYLSYLEASGYDVDTALTADDALDSLNNHIPDLIVSDALMPGGNGKGFLETIKDRSMENEICLLIVQSGREREADGNLLADERIETIAKPVRRDIFLTAIKRQLAVKTLRDDLKASEIKNEKALKYIRKMNRALKNSQKLLDREKEMLNNSLRQIALMVDERGSLKKTVADLNGLYKENFDRFIDLLSSIVESKRQYHRGHARRVADISVFIARSFQLSEEAVRNIEVSARLHEIGKLAVPEEILLKTPDECSAKDRDLLTFHPVKGATLLENFSGFQEISKIIESIHERADGKGVPRGLKKDEIPLGARIISLSSYYDNLVHGRKNISMEKVFEIIDENIGLAFDSSIVNRLRQYSHAHPVDSMEKIAEIGIFNLKPGMVLAAPIYTKKGAKLIQSGASLSDASLDQIARYSKIDPLEETVFIKG
ncbi:MAG: HD domain-containing protein [Proteobacteria bacterium]|nr:HD domain-containing protein [Pseudomonadota bacterium]